MRMNQEKSHAFYLLNLSKLKFTDIYWVYRTHAIITRSWILTVHKARILSKKPLEKTFLDFEKVGKKYTNRGL